MSRKNNIVDELIIEGNDFSFENNKKLYHGKFYSEVTNEFLSWVSKVDNYIRINYEENSGPLRMLETVDSFKFSGFDKDEFETELTKLKGAIKSCQSIKPNKKTKDNYILSLIKNPLFWTTIVVLVGGAYKLGYDNGKAKFDKEKISLKDEANLSKKEITKLKKEISQKDSLIVKLKREKESTNANSGS
ncbi:hypothetical protein DF185_14530 [Marinifilum breve]|uniref:Uncharacterized protein n=1 Tax=Marinifilum breve TaxID=2184082 RepID=A0A2V4A914_9BACT|nr:hypothetical protein [Marinifilum breve]PXX99092.1 hypothetical protein DF185_14530 [Marinifilum breve]